MPGFDGTGPRGMGAMTGRRLGRCVPAQVQAGSEQNADAQAAQVYGLGRGGMPCGCGRGFSGGRRRRV
ncbi:DUF5320 domain-containing protein [Methanoculleus taiwanensis]|uniref:DUF5320 domain-containing protein n=1 Tax=Methanoculleus taiwanensis TaxID=1550565 RepID=UPI000FFF5F53|nr:DUF5320 domain-containing protein [Methanoculleus taiwanensis]